MTEEVKVTDVKEEVKTEVVKEEVTYTEDEQRAIDLGWKPKDQWQGNDNEWVPAKWWLRFGDVEQRAQLLEQSDKQKGKVIETMKNYYLRVKEDAKKEVMETIKRQKLEAIKNEDFRRVAELDLQGEVLQGNIDKKFKQHDDELEQNTSQTNSPPPEFFEWNRHNSWYKLGSNDDMTAEADRLAVGFKNTNPQATYKDVLEYVDIRIRKIYPEKFKMESPPPTAVDDGPASIRGTSPKSGSKYKLNAQEKAAAKAFGMSEEEYAKGLQEFTERKGY